MFNRSKPGTPDNQDILREIHNMLMYKFAVTPYIYTETVAGVEYTYLCWCSTNSVAYTDQAWLVLQYATTTATNVTTAKWSSPNKAFDKIIDNGAGVIATIKAFIYYNSASINY